MIAQALTIDEFTDGTTGGNITFNQFESRYKNLSILENGFIKNATITLKGIPFNSTEVSLTPKGFNCSVSFSALPF